MKTVTIRRVEILRPGIWNGVTFTRPMLDGIVEAFAALRELLPPRVQLGHDEKQRVAKLLFGKDGEGADGFPSLGWPEKLWMEGPVLFADLAEVPERVAGWIKSKRYRARSGGLLKNVTLGDKVYPWVLDHVALLGDQAPAVPGMADMGLSMDLALAGATHEGVVAFSYEPGLGLAAGDGKADPDELSELDRIIADLTALEGRWGQLVFGRRGAPAARTLWSEFASRLKTVARENLESTMTTKPKLDLAGMTFASPEQLVGWLSGVCGVSPEDYGAIAEVVAKALGTKAPEPSTPDPAAPPAPDAAPLARTPDGAVTLSKVEADALVARLAALETKSAEATAAMVAMQVSQRDAVALAMVEGDMVRLNLPESVKGSLLELAKLPDQKVYVELRDKIAPVPVGEKGSSEGKVDLASTTLSEVEKSVAKMSGISEADFLAQKQAGDGRAPAAAT